MQRTANPRTPVQFRPRPPVRKPRSGGAFVFWRSRRACGTMPAGPGGETGKRRGLKIPRPQGHVGSTPTLGTIRLRARGNADGFSDGLAVRRARRAGDPAVDRDLAADTPSRFPAGGRQLRHRPAVPARHAPAGAPVGRWGRWKLRDHRPDFPGRFSRQLDHRAGRLLEHLQRIPAPARAVAADRLSPAPCFPRATGPSPPACC